MHPANSLIPEIGEDAGVLRDLRSPVLKDLALLVRVSSFSDEVPCRSADYPSPL